MPLLPSIDFLDAISPDDRSPIKSDSFRKFVEGKFHEPTRDTRKTGWRV